MMQKLIFFLLTLVLVCIFLACSLQLSLATGESAVVGFMRLGVVFGPLFFVCSTVPWVWPGWATGAATLLSWQFDISVPGFAVGGLGVCGLILSLGPVVYRTVETIQLVLVAVIFFLLLVLTAILIRWETVAALMSGAVSFGSIPEVRGARQSDPCCNDFEHQAMGDD